MKEFDALVIGAGMGGMATAALWAKRGKSVKVLESHYSSGGCAGYFKRREGIYDAGATTLSGLKKGRPTQRLIEELDLDVKLFPCDPGMIIHRENSIFTFHKDLTKLINEIRNEFNLDLSKEVQEWLIIEEKLWNSLQAARPIQMLSADHLFKLLTGGSLSLALKPQIFFKSFFDFLPKKARENEDFIRCLDQILMISTQQTSKTCPAFMGILGFLYPLDTYAIDGGMYGLCKSLEKKILEYGGSIDFRNPCLFISEHQNAFVVESKKEVYKAHHLILNISPEQFNKIYKSGFSIEQENDEIWGALTAYFAVKTKEPIQGCYHQVHTKKGSLFFSLSHAEDNLRKSDYQMITVSTHIDKKDFSESNKDETYYNKKNKFEELVTSKFKEAFSQYGIEEIKFDSVGTPKTFEFYTSRPEGEVGGLVHNSLWSLTRLLPNQYRKKNIFHTGDYSFPGQGIVSVFQSAFNTL